VVVDDNPNHRQEPLFWTQAHCPVCGHCYGLVYKPDTLERPLVLKCKSPKCGKDWSFASDAAAKDRIRLMLVLGGMLDDHRAEVSRLEGLLGIPQPQ